MNKEKVVATFKEEKMFALKQEWMTANVDGVKCEVNSEISGTRLEIIINGKAYTTDIADIANSLIDQVLIPQSDE
ncbi:MAG: hypothetical protein AB7U51_04365 [Arcobacter sp.]|uniref:hypothetical protein n=1 Tax=Arcobacter sp. TaxID=1872629 RepID=UPI003CFC0188